MFKFREKCRIFFMLFSSKNLDKYYFMKAKLNQNLNFQSPMKISNKKKICRNNQTNIQTNKKTIKLLTCKLMSVDLEYLT